jgi:histidinol-phosphate aminotransferase
MNNIDKLIRKNVRDLIPYSCARDDFKGREGIFLDANENPFGSLNRYPDPYQK